MADEVTERIRILLDLENEAHDRAAKKSAREIQRLEKQYDPLSRAVLKYEQEERKLARALEKGVITQARYNQLLVRAKAAHDGAVTSIERSTTAITRHNAASTGMGAVLQRNRFAVQQMGYQVGDFAVQVQGGTSAVTAFTQQGSQMLGAFGPLGAVLGAALAVGLPLASALFNIGEGADEAEKQIDGLADGITALQTAINTVDDVQRRYVEAILSGNAEVAESLLRELEIRTLLLEMQRFELNSKIDLAKEARNAQVQTVLALQEELSLRKKMLSETEAGPGTAEFEAITEEVERAAQAVSEANNAFERMQAEVKLNELLVERVDNAIKKATAAADDLAAGGEDAAASLAAAEAAADGLASVNMSLEITRAANEAARLANNLSTAQAAQRQLDQGAKVYSGRGGDPKNFAEENAQNNTFGGSTYTPAKISRGGGAGGAESPFDPLEAGAEKIERLRQQMELIGQTQARVAELTAKWQLLAAAKKKSVDLDAVQAQTGETVRQQIERQAEAIGSLADQYEQAKDRAEFFAGAQEAMKDGFLDAVVSGKDLGGVLEDLARQFARAALEASLFGSGPFSGGSGSGGVGIGGLLGGLFKSFDGGGYTGTGARSGGVDGKGGFPAILHPQETVVDHSKGGSAGGNLSGNITVTVDGDGKVKAYVTEMGMQAAQQGASLGVQTVQQSLPGWQQQLKTDGRF